MRMQTSTKQKLVIDMNNYIFYSLFSLFLCPPNCLYQFLKFHQNRNNVVCFIAFYTAIPTPKTDKFSKVVTSVKIDTSPLPCI